MVAVSASVGLVFVVRSLVLAVSLSTPVPMADQWEFVLDLMHLDDGRYGFWDLFAQHNEHRIFTARLSFFLDYELFHLDNLSVVLTDYLVTGVLAGVLAGLATRGRPFHVKLSACAWVLAALWSTAGWINLGWAFQLQWAYVHLFPALTLLCFAAAALRTGHVSVAFLAAAGVCDALGVLSMSSGLCTVVPVVALAIWTRARPRLLGAFCLWHVVVAALFLWGYQPPRQELVLDPVRLLRYVAPYLGTLLPGTKRGAILLGNMGLVAVALAVCAATWTSLARRRRLDPCSAVLLGVAVFVLTEGCATAFGRAGLPDPTAFALRYATPSEVFWTALALWAWRSSWRSGAVKTSRALAVAAFCGLVASNTAGDAVQSWADWSASADDVGFDLIAGVTTGESAFRFYPRPALIQDRIAFLRDHQLGPFAEQEARFRAPLNSLGGTELGGLPACVGVTDPWRLDADRQLHVQGWAVAPGVLRPPAWVLAYAPQGRLIGYAATWRRRAPSRAVAGSGPVPGFDSWFHLKADEDPRSITLVMVFPSGSAPPCVAPPLQASEADAAPAGPSPQAIQPAPAP